MYVYICTHIYVHTYVSVSLYLSFSLSIDIYISLDVARAFQSLLFIYRTTTKSCSPYSTQKSLVVLHEAKKSPSLSSTSFPATRPKKSSRPYTRPKCPVALTESVLLCNTTKIVWLLLWSTKKSRWPERARKSLVALAHPQNLVVLVEHVPFCNWAP